MSERFRLQQIVLAGTAYPGGQSYSTDRQREVKVLAQDSNRYEQSHVVPRAAPMVEIESHNLGWIFGAAAPWNASLDLPIALLSGDGLDLYGAKEGSNTPGLANVAEHVRHRLSAGIIHLSQLSWSKGGSAIASLRALGKSDNGETDPITRLTNIAVNNLPTGATITHDWAVTAAVLGGTAVDLESVSIAIDPALEQSYLNDLPQPVDIIGTGAPISIVVSGMTYDLRAVDGAGVSSIVLRQRSHGGGLQAQTLTLTFFGGYIWEETVAGASGGPRERNWRLTTRHDGTNRPMTWALSA
jgi:hypothetical protein